MATIQNQLVRVNRQNEAIEERTQEMKESCEGMKAAKRKKKSNTTHCFVMCVFVMESA